MSRNAVFLAVLLFTTACSPFDPALSGLTKGLSQYAAYAPLLAQGGYGVSYGVASWYGPGYVGNSTANGEIYNPYGLTAAHPSLPFGTQVRVTNMTNGASVVVRINDRGPFIAGRIIDLSQGAATQIGLIQPGTAQVQLEIISSFAQAPSAVPTAPVAYPPAPVGSSYVYNPGNSYVYNPGSSYYNVPTYSYDSGSSYSNVPTYSYDSGSRYSNVPTYSYDSGSSYSNVPTYSYGSGSSYYNVPTYSYNSGSSYYYETPSYYQGGN